MCLHLQRMQWVVSLDYEVETQRVAAASEDAVAIIDAQVNWSTMPIAIYTNYYNC